MEVVQKYKSILKYEYESCLDEIFDKEYQIQLVNDNIWYNVYTDGEYQELHDHIGEALNPFHWSLFISYLRRESIIHLSSKILLQIRQLSVAMDREWIGEYYVPQIEEGSFLMFPIYLQHRVSPCPKTDYPRYIFI